MKSHEPTSPPNQQTAPKPPSGMNLPARLDLKTGLKFHPRGSGSTHVALEDSATGKYFRLGKIEHIFVQQLMIDSSVAAAADKCAHQCALDPALPEFSQMQVAQMCGWLKSSDLCLATPASRQEASPAPSKLKSSVLAVYYFKLPLVNPDRPLEQLVRSAGWFFCWQAAVLQVLVFLLGCFALIGNWGEFFSSYQNLFTSWNAFLLLLAWCGLKLIHETAHGGTCKRYGGGVRQAGLAFILAVPIAYIDVTSSWRFQSRWQRLHVALAGVAAELGIAGLALFVWYCTDSLPLKQIAANVVLLASVMSLLFNLNPLLKFDGYFALSDLSGVDNLYAYGQSYARYFGARYVLGIDAQPPQLPERHAAWIKIYGLAAALWRTTTMAGLLIAAAAIFHGAGIVIAAVGVFSFLLQPLAKLFGHLRSRQLSGNLTAWKLVARLGCLLAAAVAALFAMPGEFRRTMPAIVEYDPPAILRAPTDGFIESVRVENGQEIQAGQPIGTLRNDALQLNLLELRKKLARVNQEIRSAHWAGDISSITAAESEARGLKQQLSEAQQQASNLIVRAPTPGQVVSRQLARMQGTYVHQGDEIAAIGMEHRKRIKVSLTQTEVSHASSWSKFPLRVVVPGYNSWSAPLTHLESRADHTPADWSLCATNGGPLPVVQTDGGRPLLCEARINAYVLLSPEQSQQLRCGQRCSVRLHSSQPSLGSQLWRAFIDTVRAITS